MKTVAPYFPLKQGSTGPAVVALKRAAAKASKGKVLPWSSKFTPVWGPLFTKKFKKLQKMLGVPVTGIYDKATHKKLAPYYDSYALKHLLAKQKPPLTKEEKMRQSVLAGLLYLYNNRNSIPYRQWRAYKKVVTGGPVPGYGDCSGSGAGVCWGTGKVKCFTGYGTWGYGNTNSFTAWMRSNGYSCNLVELEIGDMVMYNGHVAWVVGWQNGSKVHPLCYSFGSYPARILPYNYRSDIVGYFKITPV